MADLYIVATPIGNLSDFSPRAVEVLKKADIIACEDTRITQKLLNHFGIYTKTISYHKFSEKERVVTLLDYLKNGRNVALVSDAGTPLISDPGSILVETARKEGIKVVPVPGCCAVITALSAVANDGNFAFLGFFPEKQSEVGEKLSFIYDFNLVFYESPKRIIKTLELIKNILGSVKVSTAKELTKIYEDIKTLEIDEMIEYLNATTLKGEFVLILHKKKKEKIFEYENVVKKLLAAGFSQKDISKIISVIFDVSKNEVYKYINGIIASRTSENFYAISS